MTRALKPGDLDKRIQIMRPTKTDDGTAKVSGAPIFLGARWAKKTDVGDGERFAAGENATTLASRFLVRSDALTRTIAGEDVIEYKGRPYFVVGVKDSIKHPDGIEITTASRSDQS